MPKRAITGFLVAAVLPALMFGLLTPVVTRGPINTDIRSAWGLSLAAYPFACLAELVFAVPVFLALLLLDLVRWWTAAASGLVVGAVVDVMIGYPTPVQPRHLLLMATIGGVSALIFCLIWRPASRLDAAVNIRQTTASPKFPE